MANQFFIFLLCAVALPVAVSKLLHIEKVFPLVFLQLLMGLSIHLSGFDAWLRTKHSIDLQQGELGYSFYGLSALAASLLVALTGAGAAPRGAGWHKWRFVPISIVGFFSTFVLSSALGYILVSVIPGLVGAKSDRVLFSVAIGLSLSVTALPILAGVLRDMGMAETGLANLAMNCAMLDDLWMWLSVTVVLALTSAQGRPLYVLLLFGVYLIMMIFIVRSLLNKLLRSYPQIGSTDWILISITTIFTSAISTDLIGLHWVLGAFIGGTIIPERAMMGWRDALMQLNQTLLVPFFFILTGLRLKVDVDNYFFWYLTISLTLIAIIVKSCSVTLIARVTGLRWRQSFLLGGLMQCKGFMELVTINILLDAGVISYLTFSALTMMALFSTFVTSPIIRIMSYRDTATSGLWLLSPMNVVSIQKEEA